MMTSKVDFTDMYKTLDKIGRGDFWQYIGQQIKAEVKKLMTDGVDVNGNAYKAYSRQYSSWRSKNGLNTTPNLQLTSMMWKSIQARHTVTFFEVYLAGKDANDRAEWNINDRNFFSWGSKLYTKLDNAISEYLRLEGF